MWKCKLIGYYYTFFKFPREGFLQGATLLGHDFHYNNEIHHDHWHLVCLRCGFTAATEISPDRQNYVDTDE